MILFTTDAIFELYQYNKFAINKQAIFLLKIGSKGILNNQIKLYSFPF